MALSVQEILMLSVDELGARNQVTPEQALMYLNQVQEYIFNRDLDAFITLVPVDLSRVQFDNGVPYPDGDAIAPSDPVRKLLGVTTISDLSTFLGIPATGSESYGFSTSGSPVYSSFTSTNNRPRLVPITNDVWGRKVYLQNKAPWTAGYYFVYYRGAPKIVSFDNDANLIVPPHHRYSICVQGVSAHIDQAIFGNNSNIRDTMEALCQPLWDELAHIHDPDGSAIYSEVSP